MLAILSKPTRSLCHPGGGGRTGLGLESYRVRLSYLKRRNLGKLVSTPDRQTSISTTVTTNNSSISQFSTKICVLFVQLLRFRSY